MDASVRERLEARISDEVQTMLTEGDRPYLRALSRDALLATVEMELKFLGLYSHDDKETPEMIHTILHEQLDQLCKKYLLEPTVQITESPFTQPPCSTEAGPSHTSLLHYVGFTLPMSTLDVQVTHGST